MSAQTHTPAQIPIAGEKGILLARLIDGLDPQALWWLSGYSAGLASTLQPPMLAPAAAPAPAIAPATVLYASQTGNARRVAERLAADIESTGSAVRLLRADAYVRRELKDERLLYIVISTQGDGEPPDDARSLVEYLAGKRALPLPGVRFAVLGLGDSSYPQFNAVARKLDTRLAELGAERLFALGEADLDIESIADPWRRQALDRAIESTPAATPRASVVPLRAVATTPRHDRDAPFAAELLANQRISARDSEKDVRHLELSLQGSGLEYEPGDALGVCPRNATTLVDSVLDLLALDGDASISHGGETHPLRHWLQVRRELTRVGRSFLARHAALAGNAGLNRLFAAEQAAALATLLGSHQLPDMLRAWPADWAAEELVDALRPLAPRLYSIACSRKLVGEEAHLTVAHVDYQAFGHRHQGVASGYLADAGEETRIAVFIKRNERFRLPADDSRDIIMIGAGTGIAPYRAFVQERTARAASGRNWLLFGNPHFHSDFLYQVEWQEALREGRLDRLDLAFSRDQASKLYVQQRLRENSRQLLDWLGNGAHLYVCGDATRMARDVEAALLEVLAGHANGNLEQAAEKLEVLRQEGRYARDVY